MASTQTTLKLVYLIGLLSIVLLVFTVLTNFSRNLPKNSSGEEASSFHRESQNLVQDFYVMAIRHGTDKVTAHSYQHLYGLYVGPIRFKEISLLEIGLGCNMNYGPGKSLSLWREYLPKAKLDFLEFDSKCALPFKDRVNRLFTGDQSDPTILSGIRNEAEQTGGYDLIIDDGGHTRKQQINSLLGLWSLIKPNGGIYIIEDIFTGYIGQYIDYEVSAMDVLFHLQTLLQTKSAVFVQKKELDSELKQIAETLHSVNCFREACVLIKK